jgi:hypothetical protein
VPGFLAVWLFGTTQSSNASGGFVAEDVADSFGGGAQALTGCVAWLLP